MSKTAENVTRCLAFVQRAADDDGTVTFIGSTAAVDRAEDVVDQDSWKLDEYKANPVILQGHDPSRPVVGKAVSVGVEERDGVKALMFKVKFDDNPDNPDGQRIARQVREGFMSAVSVGFRAGEVVSRRALPEDDPRRGEYGYLYRNNRLFELSVVAIPMNQEALATSRALKTSASADFDAQVKAAVVRLIESGDEAIARAFEVARLAAPAPAADADWFDDLPEGGGTDTIRGWLDDLADEDDDEPFPWMN